MSIYVTSFGKLKDGKKARLFTITNKNGMQAQFTDFGAIWVSAKIPAEQGLIDTMLGFDSVEGYEADGSHMGCPIGRVANRTTGPAVKIDEKEYPLTVTDVVNGQNINNHSGYDYYEKRMWEAEVFEEENRVAFSLLSPHMDQGFPGNLHITISYTLTEDDAVKIGYHAVSDADTVFNMTNHAYFNLNGSGSVWNHRLWVDSSQYTETVKCVPTGRILPVEGTVYDYRTERPVTVELDDNFCAEPHHSLESVRTRCTGEKTGITLEVHTDLQGVQIYTGNFLNVARGKNNLSYTKGDGICFETQFYVDAMNIDNIEYKKPLLKKDMDFYSESWYYFKINNI